MLSVIATDLDGTFLTHGTAVSQENLDAVAAVLDRDIPFLFATGRPIRWMDLPDLRTAQGHPHAITNNGAAVVDLATGEVEQAWSMSADLVSEVVRDVRRALPDVVVALDYGHRIGVEEGYVTSVPDPTLTTDTLTDMLRHEDPILKVLLRCPSLDTDRFYAAAAPIVGERMTTTFSWLSSAGMLELTAAGVSKAHTLQWFCEQHRIDQAGSVAFGDMPNDLAMLQWAERGYAMPGCHPMLLEAGLPQLQGDQTTAVGRKLAELLAE